jgi:hypothetical protein
MITAESERVYPWMAAPPAAYREMTGARPRQGGDRLWALVEANVVLRKKLITYPPLRTDT